MNVLILNWRDIKHPLAGGAEISLFEQAKIWSKKGARVTWFASSFENSKKEELVDGIKIIRAGNHYTVSICFFISYIFGKFNKVDVVVDCFHFVPFFAPLFVRNKKIVALINEVAGPLWFSNINPIIAFLGYHTEPLFFKMYKNKKFITGSNSCKEDLEKLGIEKSKISVINHGVTIVPIPNSTTKEKNKTLLFLGRLSFDKGFSDVIKAFAIIAAKDPNVQLWVVGKEEKAGIFEEVLNKYVNEELIRKRIRYFGFVDQKTKFLLLRRAWLLLHASHKEGWGLTVIEAGSQMTPTIGYNVEGLRDSVVNGKTGMLVDPNPNSMANEIDALLGNADKLQRLSKEASLWSKKFTWNEAGEKSYNALIK